MGKRKHCSSHQYNRWVLLILGGRGAARVLVTASLVKHMNILVPVISVCRGTDHNLWLPPIGRNTGVYWVDERRSRCTNKHGIAQSTQHVHGARPEKATQRRTEEAQIKTQTNGQEALTMKREKKTRATLLETTMLPPYSRFFSLFPEFDTEESINMQFRHRRHLCVQ